MNTATRFTLAALFSVTSITFFASPVRSGNFGTRPVAEEVSLAEAVRAPEKYQGRMVRLSGKIADVCKKKGCWMILEEGPASVRIRFQDYSFFVPKDSTSRRAVVEGMIEAVELSKEEVEHLAAEASKSPDSIQKKAVQMTASGVLIEGYADAEPPRDPPRAGSGSSQE